MADNIQNIVDAAEGQDIEDEAANEENCRRIGADLGLGEWCFYDWTSTQGFICRREIVISTGEYLVAAGIIRI
jgi:hypothetical protein